METKTINLEVKANVDESIAGLKALKRQLKDTAAGSAEFKNIYNQIDDLEDKIKSAKNTSSDWVDSLENAGGPLGALGAGINKAKVATQTFGGALKATGIGLIVALLAGLAGAFSENEGAMKKLQPLLNGMQKLFQGIFRVVEPLFNTLVDLAIDALPMVSKSFEVVYSSVTAVFQSLGSLGSAIKKLISGDFSGAWKDAKESVTGFSKHYDKSVENFQKGTKEMTKTESEEEKKRAEERKKAQEERDAKDKAARDKRLADEKAANEKLLEEQRAFDLETLKGQQQMNLDRVNKEIQDKVDYNKNQEDKLADISNMVDALDTSNQKTIDNKKIFTDNEKKIDEAHLQQKQAHLAAGSAALKNASALLGESTTAGKAAAVAAATIDTYQSAVSSYKSLSGIPVVGPALGIAAAGVAVAAGLANIKKIVSVKTTGNVAMPSISSGGIGPISTATAPSFNVVGASPTNQLAQSIGQQQNTPIKAYVVGSDVTTQQSLDRNIVTTATIG